MAKKTETKKTAVKQRTSTAKKTKKNQGKPKVENVIEEVKELLRIQKPTLPDNHSKKIHSEEGTNCNCKKQSCI